MLSEGAAVHLCNRYGNTALHLASDRGFSDCARLLLDAGAAVDMKNNDGATALQVDPLWPPYGPLRPPYCPAPLRSAPPFYCPLLPFTAP